MVMDAKCPRFRKDGQTDAARTRREAAAVDGGAVPGLYASSAATASLSLCAAPPRRRLSPKREREIERLLDEGEQRCELFVGEISRGVAAAIDVGELALAPRLHGQPPDAQVLERAPDLGIVRAGE